MGVGVVVGAAVGVLVAVLLPVTVGVAVLVPVAVGVRVRVGVWVRVTEGVPVCVGVPGVPVSVGVFVGDISRIPPTCASEPTITFVSGAHTDPLPLTSMRNPPKAAPKLTPAKEES
jgi:hypothetical protein